MTETLTTPTAAQSSATPRTTANTTRVLVIDDNEDFRTLVAHLLEPHGFTVTLAAQPVKALEMYTRDKDKFDLVILDFYMPQLDGAKTFEWLRKLNPEIRVIICSGADELRLRQLQAQHAIDAYLHKPFRIEEALFVIRKVMAKPPRRG